MQKTSLSLLLVLFIVFLDWMGVGMVYPMFSTMLFSSEGHLFDAGTTSSMRGLYLGILLAAMPIAQFFSGPILGALSDQKGRKPLFIWSLILGILGYILSAKGAMMKSLGTIILSRFLVGIAAGNAAVVSATIADLSSHENKAKHFGLYSMACGVGFTVGPLIGGELSGISFQLPFFIAAIATFVNLLLLFFCFSETHHVRKQATIRFNEGVRNLKKAFSSPGLKVIFLTVFIFCFAWSFFFEFLPVTWIFDYQFSSETIGFFFAYGAGAYALSSGLLIRPIVDRYKSGTILFYALAIQGIIILSLLGATSQFWIWIYLPVVNFLSALVFPTSTTMVSDWAGPNAQGETLGLLSSVQSAAFALSPLAAGPLLGQTPHMPMFLGGLSMVLAALLLGILLRKEVFTKNSS